ncbi:MAG: hypothetical protein LBU70_08430 [Chitinispirillales bacterium]|jgi:hypothetical protein|nr:hypothetical protein [Chitinispirillales bacterium]
MWKFKKMFSLVTVLAAVGLFLPACESTTDDPIDPVLPTGHAITIVGGTMEFEGDPLNSGSPMFAGDTIDIFANEPADGYEFYRWSATPSSANTRFDDRYDPETFFTMPAVAVTITAEFREIEEIEFFIDITGGDALYSYDEGETWDYINGDEVFEGEWILIEFDISTLPEYHEFDRWNGLDNVTFLDGTDRYSEVAIFVMPARSLTITAVTVDTREPEHGFAYIRFAWERVWQPNIEYIFVSEEDIGWWYVNVFDDLDISDDDFVIRPSFVDGTPGLPELPEDASPLLDKGQSGEFVSPNNGREFLEVESGTFIAVLSVADPEFTMPDSDDPVIWEIVADYTIQAEFGINPEDVSLEIGFDLTRFFDGDSEWGWYGVNYEEGDNPLLSKRRGRMGHRRTSPKTIEVPGAKVTVTYYALPRTRSN